MKHTLGTVLPGIRKIIGQCDDTEATEKINVAQERLLYKGKWPGTCIRFRACTEGSCITWPRQVETIEAWAAEGFPGKLHNGWYEFLEAGPWETGSDTSGMEDRLIDRGTACCFEDIVGVNKKLRVYTDIAESAGSTIILQGYDENGNWIRTLDGSTYIDGEEVDLTASPVLTTHKFTSLTGAIKSATKGTVRIYEYNVDTGAQRVIAFYENDETHPVYRRSFIPGIANLADEDCETVTLTVMGKLRFIKAQNDNDWLTIQNEPALQLMVRALLKEDQDLLPDAEVFEQKAIRVLREQLLHHQGDGVIQPVRFVGAETWGPGIANLQ